ncbi:hypothetical protein BU25DRAFT_424413 [Macroventuria anomochaeta]|uniref:Uncharacterized protein n=1 Tax=Macroventuria anomochaeta TaxID=301207 RepID=A0ACB6RPP4_9PLEO|nr:uncharacterized protein BU25DRAFT_424413 [Macroventuria anomochaeta]KAF2624021.1 hypothetical protein BU25DRAFT_424413 [Macroventuria anomochaeta]
MQDRGGQVTGVAITFLVLTWVTVGLRCYVRTVIVKGFGLDDKVMVVTLAFFTAYLACQLGGAVHGTGQHRENITDEAAQTALRYWFFCEVLYTITTSIFKIAIGLFLLRITIVRVHIWIIRIIMAVATFVGVAYTLLVVFQCKPISYWWDLNPNHTGTCLSASLVMNFTYVVSALNSLADWTFGLLPIFVVKDLQMKRRVKVIVSAIIGLAAIGSTATIIRLPYTSTLKPYKGDFLYRTTDFAIWTTVEVGVGITAGCIATLKPLFKAALGSTSQNSGMPWSKTPKGFQSKTGGSTFGTQQALDDLRPAAERTIRTTTVTGGRGSSSDEENFLDTGLLEERWEGIRKGVTTTVTTEVAPEKSDKQRGGYTYGTSKTNKRRSFSLGQDSNSTLDDAERSKPVGTFNPFQ